MNANVLPLSRYRIERILREQFNSVKFHRDGTITAEYFNSMGDPLPCPLYERFDLIPLVVARFCADSEIHHRNGTITHFIRFRLASGIKVSNEVFAGIVDADNGSRRPRFRVFVRNIETGKRQVSRAWSLKTTQGKLWVIAHSKEWVESVES